MSMSSDWTHSFKAILSEWSHVIKKICKAIVAAHKEPGSKVTLLSSLKKAIKQYYAHEVEVEESDGKEATKERAISACLKEASFYKKKLTDWDAEQARKGDKDPIKFRTPHAQEWFNKMSPAQKKQVDYRKNNLKKVLEEFSEQLCRSMGCHVVMFNVKKSFSVSSDGIKEWASNGFEFFGEWAKMEFYPTATPGDEEEDEHGLPTVIFDEEGYAQLPSWEGVTLKNQQELVHMIFHATYSSHKPVPWCTITPCPSEYLEAGSVPADLVICDPSHMRAEDINTIWHYWERRSMAQKRLVTFIKARSCDIRINVVNSTNVKASSKKDKPYIEVGSEADEQHNALSSNRSYLELVDAVKDLATITENLPTPEGELDLPPWLGPADRGPIQSAYSAVLVVLGLGLLLRDCKRIMEYEEDEAHPDAPYYLPISVLDLQIILKVNSTISHVAGTVVGLIELAMRAGLPNDSNQEEEMQGANSEKDQEDEQEVVMGDVDVQMQEVEKDHEQEGKQKEFIEYMICWSSHLYVTLRQVGQIYSIVRLANDSNI
ncbi:hypothetical protein F4604DRAFT_1692201 [Suillus subluteus]|nr:hypothetical protein F4604DRAFT_1692201 [Suillus subluteus]